MSVEENDIDQDFINRSSVFLRNDLAANFKELNDLINSPDFNATTQPDLIKAGVCVHANNESTGNALAQVSQSSHTLENTEEATENTGDSGNEFSKKRKLETESSTRGGQRIPANEIIARIVKSSSPIIDRTIEYADLISTGLMIINATSRLNLKDVDEALFGGQLASPFDDLKHVTIKFHENLCAYHKKRAEIIHNHNSNNITDDSLMAIAELDVKIFFEIRQTLFDIRKAYHLGLKIDKIFSSAEVNENDRVGH